jgi:argininosuccinate lyase
MRGMEEFAGLADDKFAKLKGYHHGHANGIPQAQEISDIDKQFKEAIRALGESGVGPSEWTKMDLAWVVCLYKANIINRKNTAKVLKAVKKAGGTEKRIIEALKGDEDTGSIPSIGRTLQEPMSRLKMRDAMIESFENFLELLETVLEQAEKNVDTIMPGHTHLSQAQPITLAHYLLSIFEGLARGVEQLELAYKYVNRNSGGCGACSGISWPVDRWYLTKLLGFEELVEPTYDSESAQDHSLALMFALTNIELLITKTSIDMEIWTTEEMDMLRVHPAWCGNSSMMPQKCHPGSRLERIRIPACDCIGEMMKSVVMCKGEPHQDVLPMVRIPARALYALASARYSVRFLNGFLKNIYPQKKRMMTYVTEGFSCATEVVVYMVKNLNYGGRRAHRIVATFVRMAREKGLKATETTGQLLDQAASYLEEKQPHIETQTLLKLLNPVEFIHSHNNVGGTAPEEAKRLISIRRKVISQMQDRQKERRKKVQQASDLLEKEVKNIIGREK